MQWESDSPGRTDRVRDISAAAGGGIPARCGSLPPGRKRERITNVQFPRKPPTGGIACLHERWARAGLAGEEG